MFLRFAAHYQAFMCIITILIGIKFLNMLFFPVLSPNYNTDFLGMSTIYY
jgi:hypothetical protein